MLYARFTTDCSSIVFASFLLLFLLLDVGIVDGPEDEWAVVVRLYMF
jgi:hypothetical protein